MITDQQFEQLCVWAGFKKELSVVGLSSRYIWYREDDHAIYYDRLPPRDMNTVFKWLWPKLSQDQLHKAVGILGWESLHLSYEDKLEAILSAIWEVVHETQSTDEA